MSFGTRNGKIGMVERAGIEPADRQTPDVTVGTDRRAPLLLANRICRSTSAVVALLSGVLRCTQTYSVVVERRSRFTSALSVQNGRAACPCVGRFVFYTLPPTALESSATGRGSASASRSSGLTQSRRAMRSTNASLGSNPRSISDSCCCLSPMSRATCCCESSLSRRILRRLRPTSFSTMPSCGVVVPWAGFVRIEPHLHRHIDQNETPNRASTRGIPPGSCAHCGPAGTSTSGKPEWGDERAW